MVNDALTATEGIIWLINVRNDNKRWLRVSEANEVSISRHKWVALTTFKQVQNLEKKSEKIYTQFYDYFRTR